MTEPDRRAQLARTITEEQHAWRQLVAEIGPERRTLPGPMGEWTFVDLAAHLLGWRERMIARLEAAGDGRPEPPEPWPDGLDDDDAINDWFQEQAAGWDPDAVLADADRSYDRLREALTGLSDDQLSLPGALGWLDGASVIETDWLSHWHEEHEPTVRGWLAGTGTGS